MNIYDKSYTEELDVDKLERVTAGYQTKEIELRQQIKELKSQLSIPGASAYDRERVYAKLTELEEELSGYLSQDETLQSGEMKL